MQRVKILALFFLSLASFSSFSSVSSCNDESLNNFILIHGIGGNVESFGEMKNTIPNDLECAVVHEYAYATEDSLLTPEDFARGLNTFISKIPWSGKRKDLNLIAHSQGGLISLIWIVKSLKNEEGYSSESAKRVNTYTTLSTPFWGSDFALMGDYTFFGLGLKDNSISPFGKKQLELMQYGSSYFRDMIEVLISPENEFIRNYLKNDIRILNVKATLPKVSSFTNSIGAQFFEGDAIVNLPSMTLNFNFAELLNEDYSTDKNETAIIKENHLASESYTYGSHMFIGPGVEAVAEVPIECLSVSDCNHIAYKNFKDFYLKNIVNSDSKIESDLQGFELHVIVELPENHEEDTTRDMKINIIPSEDISMSYYLFDHDDQEPLTIIDNKLYFVLKGSITNDQIKKSSLGLSIDILNTKQRNLKINVTKGLVTILKTNLTELDQITKDYLQAKRKEEKKNRLRKLRRKK